MKILGLTIVLLLSLASASAACSMSYCAGNKQCCCTNKSGPIPHSKNTGGFSQTHQSAATSADGCSCRDNSPQPFSDSHAITLLQSIPSHKDGGHTVAIFKNTRLPTGNFTLDANYSPPYGHIGLTIPIPLRI